MTSRSSTSYAYPTPDTTPVKNAQWGQREDLVRCRGCGHHFTAAEWDRHVQLCPAILQMSGRAPIMKASENPASSGFYSTQQYASSAHYVPTQPLPITPQRRGSSAPAYPYSGQPSGTPTNLQPQFQYYQNPTPPHTPPANATFSGQFQIMNDPYGSPSSSRTKANRKRGVNEIKMYDGASHQFYNPTQ